MAASDPGEPEATAEPAAPAAAVFRNYEVLELTPIINRALNRGGRDFARGEEIYDTIGCRMCHLFNGGAGGIGPDLSGVGGRFGALELLKSILTPSEDVSDLYGTLDVWLADGSTVRGRRKAETATELVLYENYVVDPSTGTASWIGGNELRIPNDEIVWVEDSYVSPMPPGMINGLSEEDITDLFAYLISGGNPNDSMFRVRATDAGNP